MAAKAKNFHPNRELGGLSNKQLTGLAVSGQLTDFDRPCLTSLQLKSIVKAASVPKAAEKSFSEQLTRIVNRASFDYHRTFSKTNSADDKDRRADARMARVVAAADRLRKELATIECSALAMAVSLSIKISRKQKAGGYRLEEPTADELNDRDLNFFSDLDDRLRELIDTGGSIPRPRKGRPTAQLTLKGTRSAYNFFLFSLLDLIVSSGGKACINKDGRGSLTSVLRHLKPALPTRLLPAFIAQEQHTLSGVGEVRRMRELVVNTCHSLSQANVGQKWA